MKAARRDQETSHLQDIAGWTFSNADTAGLMCPPPVHSPPCNMCFFLARDMMEVESDAGTHAQSCNLSILCRLTVNDARCNHTHTHILGKRHTHTHTHTHPPYAALGRPRLQLSPPCLRRPASRCLPISNPDACPTDKTSRRRQHHRLSIRGAVRHAPNHRHLSIKIQK